MSSLRNSARKLGSGDALKQKDVHTYVAPSMASHCVYFLRLGKLIKIGETDSLPRRFSQFATEAKRHGSAEPVLLAAVHGNVSEQDRVRNFFASLSVGGTRDSFHPGLDLLRYIRWLRDCHFVDVGENGTPSLFPVVDPDAWMPGPGREKAVPVSLFADEATFEPRRLTGDDYYTPAGIIEVVRKVLGGIDLDPASHPVANQVVQAHRIYGRAENGLIQPWRGRVWLNPPFDQWPEFGAKLLDEISAGRTTEALALATTPTISALYFAPVLQACHGLVVLYGRPEYWGPLVELGNGSGPSTGAVLLYFGENPTRLQAEFEKIGRVFL